MRCEKPDLIESLQLTTTPEDYFWVSQGVTKVDGMDDKEEFDATDVSHSFWFSLNNTYTKQTL